MKRIFFDSDGRLRNGWWIGVFVALFLASRVAYTPVVRGLKAAGMPEAWLEPMPFCFAALVTWLCVRLRGQALASVGFALGGRWFREAGWGTLLGAGAAVCAAVAMWSVGGVVLELDPARDVTALLQGAYVFLFVALLEETLFRGFVFQRLVDGAGIWIAQLAFALLFAASHWGNPDMHGATLAVASVELGLGAILLGLAWLRTRSLALPVGIHLGWNWAQGPLLGFDVSGFGQAGWLRPVPQDVPAWVTGAGFGLEASVLAVLVDLVLIVLLWRWKGVRGNGREPVPAPAVAAATAAAG